MPTNVLAFPRTDGRYADLSAYPKTEQGWKDRYDRLWCAYLSEPYDLAEIKAFHLFRALDDDNAEIDVTRRVFSLYRFITEIDVGGILGGRVALEVEDGLKVDGVEMTEEARAKLLVDGEAVWKRSVMDDQMEPLVRTTAALGDSYMEAVRTSATKPYRTTLVRYDPREVTPYYDQVTGSKLVKVVINKGYLGSDAVAPDGVIDDDTPHTYRREITETRIDVWIDGVKREELSGEHNAGTIPVVHLQFTPFTEPDHGLPAANGIDQAVMMCDSLATQARAIGNRTANPIGYVAGAKLAENSSITKFGRWLSGLPADAKVGYVETGGNAVDQLRAQIDQLLHHIQRTSPEFMFADTETNVSGESLTYKAAAFENKVGNARTRIFGGICRITAIAVAMDADQPADVERLVYKIDAPPVLPRNGTTELDNLIKIRGQITPGDFVRGLQRLGHVGLHHDPETYALKVATVNKIVATAGGDTSTDAS
jgi:hypothetical protein